eukprot:6459812-Amphidinium_carterae.1
MKAILLSTGKHGAGFCGVRNTADCTVEPVQGFTSDASRESIFRFCARVCQEAYKVMYQHHSFASLSLSLCKLKAKCKDLYMKARFCEA